MIQRMTMNSPYILRMEESLDYDENHSDLLQFPSATALLLAPFPKYIEYNLVLLFTMQTILVAITNKNAEIIGTMDKFDVELLQ